MENTAASCTIIRNGRKSSRQIIGRPFRSARIAEKTFSRNGVPAHSAASAATPAVSSGGRTIGKQIHPWRKSPCGANAAGRRCAQIRKSIADVPAISEPWKKRTASRYARGAEKNFRSMQVKNASIAAGTVPSLLRVRQRIFAEAAVGSRIQNRKAGQSIIKKAAREAELSRDSKRVRLVCRKTSMYAGIDSLSAKISAVIYSLVETAKTNGLNPASYLQYILTTLPRGSLPGDCLPWLPTVQAICKA